MGEERKDKKESSGDSGLPERIPFQIETDMRKGPPSSAVIRLHGVIDAKQNRLIGRIISPLLKAKVKHVVVDFSDVSSIEPEPVRTLADFAKKRKAAGMRNPCSLTGLRLTVVEAIKAAKPGKGIFVAYKYFHDAVKSLKLKGLPDLYIAGARPTGLNMRLMVKVVPRGKRVALVTPYGYVREPEARFLSRVLRRVSLMEVQNIVIDMTGISYADSHALKSISDFASAWQKTFKRRAVALAGAKPGIRLGLTTLGVGRSTFLCDSVDEALSKLEKETRYVTPAAGTPADADGAPSADVGDTVEKALSSAEEEKEPAAPVKAEAVTAAKTGEVEERKESEEKAEICTVPAEEEEPREKSAFSTLASKDSSDTGFWILKNVQSILSGKKGMAQEDKQEVEAAEEETVEEETVEEAAAEEEVTEEEVAEEVIAGEEGKEEEKEIEVREVEAKREEEERAELEKKVEEEKLEEKEPEEEEKKEEREKLEEEKVEEERKQVEVKKEEKKEAEKEPRVKIAQAQKKEAEKGKSPEKQKAKKKEKKKRKTETKKKPVKSQVKKKPPEKKKAKKKEEKKGKQKAKKKQPAKKQVKKKGRRK